MQSLDYGQRDPLGVVVEVQGQGLVLSYLKVRHFVQYCIASLCQTNCTTTFCSSTQHWPEKAMDAGLTV